MPSEDECLRWNRNPATPTIDVDGLTHRSQWIASLVKQHGWALGAELGVCRGDTFLFLLDNCPDLTMIGVDLWSPQPGHAGPETYERCDHADRERTVREGSAGHGDRAIIIKDWTVDAAEKVEDGSLDFVFIDADHSTEAVRADIIAWTPKVKETGWILGHDINWSTVRAVADELLPGYVIGPDNAWGRSKRICLELQRI